MHPGAQDCRYVSLDIVDDLTNPANPRSGHIAVPFLS